jgi:hypothetical protein
MSHARLALALLAALAFSAVAAAPASAQGISNDEKMPQAIPSVDYDGVQHLRYRFGPVKIIPGANSIEFDATNLKPPVPGYITRFTPNLERADGTVPPVDELHLHHAVWIAKGYPTFAAGEEKTITQLPKGFGYKYDPKDPVDRQPHDPQPAAQQGPGVHHVRHRLRAGHRAGAQDIKEAKPLWLDVSGPSAYPVFDVKRAWGGSDGQYTFPDDVKSAAERQKIGFMRKHTADKPMTLIGTAGHLHPGGLFTTMKVKRAGQEREVFKSEAKYWEPAGAVSWDVAMTADAAGLARRGQAGRRDRDLRRPTTRAGPRGTSRWGSWSPGTPTTRRPPGPTRSPTRSTPAARSRTATCPRTTTTAARPTGPARPAAHARRHADQDGDHQGLRLRPRRSRRLRPRRSPARWSSRASR